MVLQILVDLMIPSLADGLLLRLSYQEEQVTK